VLAERCVRGITANVAHLRAMVENSISIVTALNPFIGYERATAVAKEASETGLSVYQLVLMKGWMSKQQLDEVLRPEVLTQPRYLTTAPTGEEAGAP
jgi:aspartate ammonia-lyase